MSSDLENFQQHILENNLPFTDILLKCLNFVEMHPENADQIGCLWNSKDSFAMNSKIFSNFISKHANTINKHLRCKGFKRNRMNSLTRKQIPDKFNFQKNS